MFIEKNPRIRGPMQLKPVLFKGYCIVTTHSIFCLQTIFQLVYINFSGVGRRGA